MKMSVLPLELTPAEAINFFLGVAIVGVCYLYWGSAVVVSLNLKVFDNSHVQKQSIFFIEAK